VKNAEIFSKALADNSDGVNSFLSSMADVGRTLKPLSVKLEALSSDLDTLVKSVDPARVKSVVNNVDSFTATLAKIEAPINAFLADASSAAKRVNDGAGRLDSVLAGADTVIKGIDPAKVTAAIDGVARVATSGAKVIEAVDPAQVKSVVAAANGLAATLDKNRVNIDSFIADAAGSAKQINAASGRLDGVLASASDALKGIDAAKVRAAIDDFGKLAASGAQVVAAVDPAKVRAFVDSASGLGEVITRNKGNIDSIIADAAVTMRNVGDSSGRLEGVLTGAADLFKGLDPGKINGVVDQASRFMATLDGNRGNVDAAFRNAAELTGKLNNSADRVDGVLKSLDDFLGNASSNGVINQIADAARSIRKLADNLDVRTKDIATGITRFTGPGLREYEALAADGRRTLNDLNRAVRTIERNPSSVIFGAKPALPEYKGQ
jgi:phospholipid/cholesterol/gamma-HCH transport system substrate-binding protein